MKEFSKRRAHLMEMMGDRSIAILPSASVRRRNRDVDFPFRQDSDFHYLTGFPEPEAMAVLLPGRAHGEYILFCRERDPEKELWDGSRAGQEGACSEYLADDAFPIGDADDILPGLLENCERVFYTIGNDPGYDRVVIEWVNSIKKKSRNGVHAPQEFVGLDHFLHEMRLYKSRSELSLMRKAARISEAAHLRVMKHCRPGVMEYQLEAEFVHEIMKSGCRATAYPSIVASGGNSCVLHYTDNSARLEDKELLLIDAGAEFDGYAADVTRTYPVNGHYSAAQQAIYEIVLKAQLAAIDQVRPGNHWNDPHIAAVREITRGLMAIGLLKGRLNTLIKQEAYKPFYMHRTGHWLDMDVHDVGEYKIDGQWRALEPGMVLTVEPGIYIPAGSKGVARKWWNIGVRIEDDVVVTRDGNEVLTKGIPKQVEAIEAVMAAGS